MVRAESLYGERDRAARSLDALEHPVVVEGEYGNRRRAEENPDDGPRRARAWQENSAWHDKRTPPHGIAEGKRNNRQRRQVGAESSRMRCFHVA